MKVLAQRGLQLTKKTVELFGFVTAFQNWKETTEVRYRDYSFPTLFFQPCSTRYEHPGALNFWQGSLCGRNSLHPTINKIVNKQQRPHQTQKRHWLPITPQKDEA